MSANCTAAQLKALTDFGYHVGLAFQVIDDILDVTQTSEQLGKTAGKDTKAQKATYPSIVGLEKSRQDRQDADGSRLRRVENFSRTRRCAGSVGRLLVAARPIGAK